jgi:hypothetical protein
LKKETPPHRPKSVTSLLPLNLIAPNVKNDVNCSNEASIFQTSISRSTILEILFSNIPNGKEGRRGVLISSEMTIASLSK